MEQIANLLAGFNQTEQTHIPQLFRLKNAQDKTSFEALLTQGKVSAVHDEIYGQLQELVKSLNPAIKIKKEDYPALVEKHLNGQNIQEYGVWVYYPWSKKLVHLLDDEEFIEVRTNRNRYKITKAEQDKLRTRKIGIVGLSVGQSIALTMAMERICGELRLADFDTAELSNLNRIRTGTHNLGLNKTIIAAREILEIDPFLNIKIFNDGLHAGNMDEFFTGGGKLDLFVEVCDGLDVKIESRYKARELQIPVVMDTNDRGMMDVERFDLDPQRPVLHGLADGLDPNNIKDLTNEEKIPYILKMIGADTISTRLKASMLEVEQSINTWPQLASSVTLGGALTTDVSRRILLDQYHESGRYYIDLEELIGDKEPEESATVPDSYLGPPQLTEGEMLNALQDFIPTSTNAILSENIVTEIVEAGLAAPSGGNVQPWKLVYTHNGLFIFHEEHYSYSLLDFNHLGSYLAIGAMVENIRIKAAVLGYDINTSYFPIADNKKVIAHISFQKTGQTSTADKLLEPGITLRVTNREVTVKETLSPDFYSQIKSSVATYHGAELHIVEDAVEMKELGNILATAEMLRFMHPRGHYDTFTNELRWTPEQVNQTKDGLDVNSLGATNSELAGFKVAGDSKAIGFLRELHGGGAFTKMVNKAVGFSSALGIVTMPKYSDLDFLLGGRAVERIWIEANLAGISFQPISQFVFMLARLINEPVKNPDDAYYNKELEKLGKKFSALFPQLSDKQPIFMFRLAKAGEPKVRSLRRPLEASFIYMPNV
ncbi:MAG: Rv1355c family protein [Mucilaginibacter sp.]